MRITLASIALLLLLAVPAHAQTQSGMPLMTSVEPASARVGGVLTVQGVNLGADSVAVVYLTDGTNDTAMAILEQKDTSIQCRIPREGKPGRFALMVLTKGKDARLIEQPVKVTIEAEGASPTAT